MKRSKNRWVTRLFCLAMLLLFCQASLAGEGLRQQTVLGSDWRFQFNDEPDIGKVQFEHVSDWEAVSVPHTWNNLDGQDGGGNYRAGIAWYYRELQIPETSRNIYLQFNAVNRDAEVYLNGKLLGRHEGGYSAFRFKLNEFLNPDGINRLAVKVRNYPRMEANTPPNRADYTFFGGIYRPVSLLMTDELHISALDYASLGSYVKQKSVSEEKADLEIKTLVSNDSAEARKFEVNVRVLNDAEETVAEVSKDYQLEKAGQLTSLLTLQIDHPHLWQGVEDPYLYTVHTDIVRDGKVVDRVTQRLGLRYYHVDPEKGFFLNGKHLKLRGVNRHQDRLNKGWAISDEDTAEDVQIMLDMGVNSARLAHYQQSQKIYDLCDESGIIVSAEIPYVDYMQDNEHFFSNAFQQMRELIRQNFHHSSILFWGIGNETKESPTGAPSIKLLNDLEPLVKAEDDSRLTIYAHNGSPTDEKLYVTDVAGWNRYYGWYGGDANRIGWVLDNFHEKNPDRALSLTEYGAGGSIYQHADDFTVKPDPRGRPHPEEYQSYLHEEYLKAITSRDFIFASWLWNMFDFAADQRDEGDTAGRNDKGLVTYDRKTKKDVFYLYKANWSPEPVCYITSRRYVERKKGKTYIKVYSNCEEVEAFLNGKSLGKVDKDSINIFFWPDVDLVKGRNEIEVKGMKDGEMITDSCVWNWDGTATADQGVGVGDGLVQASKFQKGNEPGFAYDGKPDTRWAAVGEGEWIQIDLEEKKTIKGVKILFHQPESRQYTIDIEVSEDGPFWKKVVENGVSQEGTSDFSTFTFEQPVTVQYVRVIGKGNTRNNWISIAEIKVVD